MPAYSPFSTNCCACAFTTLAASARSWAGAQRRAAVCASVGISRGEIERGQRTLSGLADLAADLAGEAEALQARDLALSFQPRRVIGGQTGDQLGDAIDRKSVV